MHYLSKASQPIYKPDDRFVNQWPVYKPVKFSINSQHIINNHYSFTYSYMVQHMAVEYISVQLLVFHLGTPLTMAPTQHGYVGECCIILEMWS